MKSLEPFKGLITPAAKHKVCEEQAGGAWKTLGRGDGYLQDHHWWLRIKTQYWGAAYKHLRLQNKIRLLKFFYEGTEIKKQNQ